MRKRNAARNNNTVPGFLSKTYKILEVRERVISVEMFADNFLNCRIPNMERLSVGMKMAKHSKSRNQMSLLRKFFRNTLRQIILLHSLDR